MQYGVADWPPLRLLLPLGLQYTVQTATYLVFVAVVLRAAKLPEDQVVGLMGVACVALAAGVVLQALPRGPVGCGYLAPTVYSSTYLAPAVLAAGIGGMPLVFSMTIVGGLTEILLATVLGRLRIVITPVVTGLSVFVVGMQVGIVGIAQVMDIPHEHQAVFRLHLVVTTLTLGVMVALTIWGKGMLKLLCTLTGLVVGMLAAIALGVVSQGDAAVVYRAPWFALPQFTLPVFDLDMRVLPAFVAAGVAATVRVIGNITTAQRLNDPDWERPDMANLRKGVIGEGMANVVAGVIGAQGMTISSSLVAMQGNTGVASRAVAYTSAAMLLVMGVVPKLSVFFLMVPQEVTGALLVYTACSLISGGMRIMLSRAGGPRASFIIGIPTLLAMSKSVHPHFFKDMSPIIRNIIGNPLTIALVSAAALVLLFRIGTRQRAAIAWSPGDDAVARTASFLRDTAAAWDLPRRTTEAAEGEIRALVGRLSPDGRYGMGGELRLTTDGIDFRADVTVRGGTVTPSADPAPADGSEPGRTLRVRDEESVELAGLESFLQSLAAERKRLTRRDGQTTVMLRYAV